MYAGIKEDLFNLLRSSYVFIDIQIKLLTQTLKPIPSIIQNKKEF